jgi:putative membrane protein
MAQMALTRSRAPKVRRFARRLVADQQSLDATLEVLAINKGTSVPNVLDADSEQRRLGSLSGQVFDQAFATQMLAAHERAIALYSAATSLSDRDVANFAARALPMLRAHKAQAGSLVAGVPPRAE